jgi:hypothetical protein
LTLAIACASGGYRVAFTMGVLTALEQAGLRADAYAGTSASVIPAALAAVGDIGSVAHDYAKAMLDYKTLGKGMSGVALESLTVWGPLLHERLFQPGMPRFCIPVSTVMTTQAVDQTQSSQARRLGRNLLLAAARHDSSWAKAHLKLELFDTQATDPSLCLTPDNFDAVAYASTRMLHAWDIPAWIAGRAYVDGSYTCMCPARELAALGYDEVIAISTEIGSLHTDLFANEEVPDHWHNVPIRLIRPDIDPKDLGADFTDATAAGLLATYRHGEEKGQTFLRER